ncbi:MAG: DnaJ domain-containing protein [Candidatus Sulfopaludibacter sp.]|nr:DnaJ domain-containing protein [Candidatus Sulfopaludibacter sp.]
MNEARWEPRQPKPGQYSLTWRGQNSNTYSTEGNGLDVSSSGVGIECPTELKAGSIVFLQARDGSIHASYEVVYCTRRGARFRVGLEAREEAQDREKPAAAKPAERPVEGEADHYETLQINSKADLQTIHRVFRIMAARFHPDNPETGNVEQFLRMKRAYAVLSDPERRREYDAILETNKDDGPRPIFELKDFVTGVEAEANRRLGVLCLLYRQRQTNPDAPGVSLLDLEREMGFPREYLSFTTWYLRSKDYVTVADNSDYALTALGADFVEKKAVRHEIVGKLLNPSLRVRRPGTAGKDRQKSASPPSRPLLTA